MSPSLGIQSWAMNEGSSVGAQHACAPSWQNCRSSGVTPASYPRICSRSTGFNLCPLLLWLASRCTGSNLCILAENSILGDPVVCGHIEVPRGLLYQLSK